MFNKYKRYDTDIRILKFIETGNYNYFTRDNNARDLMIRNNITPEVLKYLLVNTEEIKRKRVILEKAVIDTYAKYGKNQAFWAINNGMDLGFQNFTNDNNGRDMLKSILTIGEIKSLIISSLLSRGFSAKEINIDDYSLYIIYLDCLENEYFNRKKR